MSVGREEFLCPFRSIRSFDDTKVSHGYTHHIHTGREGKKGVLPTLALQSLSEPKFGLGLSATCLSYHPFFFFFFRPAAESHRLGRTTGRVRLVPLFRVSFRFVSFTIPPATYTKKKKKKVMRPNFLPVRSRPVTRHTLRTPLHHILRSSGPPAPWRFVARWVGALEFCSHLVD